MTCFAFGAKCSRPGRAGLAAGAAPRAPSPSREVSAAQPTAELTPVAKNWRRVRLRRYSLKGSIGKLRSRASFVAPHPNPSPRRGEGRKRADLLGQHLV